VLLENEVKHNLSNFAAGKKNWNNVLLLRHVLYRMLPGEQHVKKEKEH